MTTLSNGFQEPQLDCGCVCNFFLIGHLAILFSGPSKPELKELEDIWGTHPHSGWPAWLGLEPGICWSWSKCSNHWPTLLYLIYTLTMYMTQVCRRILNLHLHTWAIQHCKAPSLSSYISLLYPWVSKPNTFRSHKSRYYARGGHPPLKLCIH